MMNSPFSLRPASLIVFHFTEVGMKRHFADDFTNAAQAVALDVFLGS